MGQGINIDININISVDRVGISSVVRVAVCTYDTRQLTDATHTHFFIFTGRMTILKNVIVKASHHHPRVQNGDDVGEAVFDCLSPRRPDIGMLQ